LIRPGFITWYVDTDEDGDFEPAVQWGLPDDLFAAGEPLAGQQNGYEEIVVYRSGAFGEWFVAHNDLSPVFSGAYTFRGNNSFGIAGAIPVIADFDSDGADEAAVSQTGGFFVDMNSNLVYDYGDVPTSFDPGGNITNRVGTDWLLARQMNSGAFADRVVCRDPGPPSPPNYGTFEIYLSNWVASLTWTLVHSVAFGFAGDLPAVGDINGDGRDDLLLFRPSAGLLFINLYEAGDPNGGYADHDVDRLPVA